MGLELNPFKAIGNVVKAGLSAVLGEPLRCAFNIFKDVVTLHPIQAVEEPFKAAGCEFKNIGTILSLGTYKGNVDQG